MSDKLKGQIAKSTTGGHAATRVWQPVTPSRPTGRKVPRNWGAYVPLGDDPDGDKNTSSPYATHRGILKGGDRRIAGDGHMGKHKRTYPLQGNPWDKASG